MIDEKNLDPDAADRIGKFVRMSGGVELIETLLTTDLVSFLPRTLAARKPNWENLTPSQLGTFRFRAVNAFGFRMVRTIQHPNNKMAVSLDHFIYKHKFYS